MRRTTVTRKCSKKTGRNLKSSIRKISNSNISLVSKRASKKNQILNLCLKPYLTHNSLFADYYLTSSDQLSSCLFDISAKKVLASLHAEPIDGFNESIMRVLCLNQAISKMQKELHQLSEVRENILLHLEQVQTSEKLSQFLYQMRNYEARLFE